MSPCGGLYTRHPSVFNDDALDLCLAQGQVFAIVHGLAHAQLVGLLVGLGPQRVHRRALAGVQHSRLYEYVVDGAAHLAPQGVQLPYQMALGRASDGRVAGHHRQGIQVQRGQQRGEAHPGAGERGLTTRMPRADHHHVKAVCYQNKPTSRHPL